MHFDVGLNVWSLNQFEEMIWTFRYQMHGPAERMSLGATEAADPRRSESVRALATPPPTVCAPYRPVETSRNSESDGLMRRSASNQGLLWHVRPAPLRSAEVQRFCVFECTNCFEYTNPAALKTAPRASDLKNCASRLRRNRRSFGASPGQPWIRLGLGLDSQPEYVPRRRSDHIPSRVRST